MSSGIMGGFPEATNVCTNGAGGVRRTISSPQTRFSVMSFSVPKAIVKMSKKTSRTMKRPRPSPFECTQLILETILSDIHILSTQNKTQT